MAGPVIEPPDAQSGGADDAGRGPGGHRDWRWLLRKAVVPAISLAVVVGIAAVIPRFASYRVVWRSMTTLDGRDWAFIAGCTVLNVATSGPPWMAAVPGLTYKRSMLLTQTSSLMTAVLPLGEAVGFATQIAMLRRWRFSSQVVSAGFVLVAGCNQLINVIVPVASIAALGAGHANPLYRTVSLIAGVVLVAVAIAVALLFRSPAQARRIGDFAGRIVSHAGALFHRPPFVDGGDRLVAMRSQTIAVVARRWPFLTIATLVNQLTVFGVLLACLAATGVHGITLVEALASWSFARLISSIAITPGGLGMQELGLTGALIAFGGSAATVIATALLFRVVTFVPTVVVGSACALIWRREQQTNGE
jgi:uncharacterized membrane protein YbhN (UPF0104 family)